MEGIRGFRELKVWQKAMDAAMLVFEFSRQFPKHELYSLTDQVCRSSRSVPSKHARSLDSAYEEILAMLTSMASRPDQWTLRKP